MLFISWELMSGLGWGDVIVRSLIGRIVCVFLSAIGIVCIALLTATFYSLSELGATEGSLIKAIERRVLGTAEREAAVLLMQTWARRRLVRLRERRSGRHAPCEKAPKESRELVQTFCDTHKGPPI